MKNTPETLASEKFYTTKMSDCANRQHNTEGFVIRIKGYPDMFESSRFFDAKKINNTIFIYGRGHVKIKVNNIIPVTVPKVETYLQLFELVRLYGYRCACQMIGLDLQSYGNAYPISDIAKMETFGIEYVEYLERLASLDFKILQYFCTELKLKVRGNSYDMWIEQGEENKYGCLFRQNPFLGFNMESCYFGMIPVTPFVDPIAFDENLQQVIMKFHPEYEHKYDDIEKYSELKTKYDIISVKGWVEKICGKEDTDWLTENLNFKGSPLQKELTEV